jgi:ferredoxin
MSAGKKIGVSPGGAARILEHTALDHLLDALSARGYAVVGPRELDGVITYEEVNSPADLPFGWSDVQAPASYRLERSSRAGFFDWAVGPDSFKRRLRPANRVLWTSRRQAKRAPEYVVPQVEEPPLAFFGIRPCDLAAVHILDRVLGEGEWADPDYTRRRTPALVVVAQCGSPASSCFCASMGTGPFVKEGFDLSLSELPDADPPCFVVRSGSPRGSEVLDSVPTREAEPAHLAAEEAVKTRAVARMSRTLDTEGIRDLLLRNQDHPRWETTAQRCLSCANCTMVCPTCFCANVEDVTDLSGDVAERRQTWDSCFAMDHSWLHGGSVRRGTRARYRQWVTHKLASWIDQFGTSGCTGCGRCITWCPAAIELTAEVDAIRQSRKP